MSLLILPRRFKETVIDLKNEAGIESITTISAKYQVAICRNGHVVRKPFGDKWIPNLITNVALDQLMQGTAFHQFIAGGCRVGSGTTSPANTDTALTTPLRGSTTQFTGGGAGTTIGSAADTINGAVTHTNVYEFGAEVGSVTYNEVGLANSIGPTGGNLYTHSLFPSGVSLVSGDNLRLTYAMTFSIPLTVTQQAVSLSAINGFNISGNLKAIGPFIYGIFSQLVSSGGVNGGQDAGMRNSSAGTANLFTSPTVFPSVNTGINPTAAGSGVSGTLGTYTTGSFSRTNQFIWIPSNPAATTSGIAGICWNLSGINLNYGYMMLLFTTTQTKANTNTLTLNTSSTIARA